MTMANLLKLLSLSFCIFALPMQSKAQNTLTPFVSDGCTGVSTDLPNFNGYDDFAHCCVIHDVVYWIGGPLNNKPYADRELKECLNDANPVTLFTNVPTQIALDVIGQDHWGKGWTISRDMSVDFSKAEISEIYEKLKTLRQNAGEFNLQFRMNQKQNQYIEFWLTTFENAFKADFDNY